MPKIAKELTALQVKNITDPGLHAVGGVPGLHLQVTESKARSWVLRVRVGIKRRDIGLGSYPGTTLAQAREAARDVRQQVRNGIDPVLERQAARARLIAAQAKTLTFDEAVRRYMPGKRQEVTPSMAKDWEQSLACHASPIIGKMRVDDIEIQHVIAVLEPMWATKTPTATRLRGRIESILAWATVRGYRRGDNPARWKNNLDVALPDPSKIASVTNMAALPYKEMPGLLALVRQKREPSARVLELMILTACRSGEARGADWSEIDFDKRVWTIPGTRMKTGREHVVPLTDAAMDLLNRVKPNDHPVGLVFPGRRGDNIMDDSIISGFLRRMKIAAVPHGMRSSFRTWAAEETDHPNHVCEMALAHVVQGVEGAYRRGDLLDKRRKLMDDWADYLAAGDG